MVAQLSIGEISTLIAAAVFVARFIVPNAFGLLLVRLVGQEQNATTWGFVQRSLARTDWPVILRTDSMANGAVDTRIKILNWLQIITTIVLAFAAVLTPAGLYDVLRTDSTLIATSFTSVKDQGVFGISSQNQNSPPWRTCQDYYFPNNTVRMDVNCPGSNGTYTITHNSSGYFQSWNGGWNVAVPKSRAAIFHSGLADLPSTVSSFFDIKPRRITRSTGDNEGQYAETLAVDNFQFRQTVIDTSAYQVIDGLVVDAKSGAIGFRNHTLPMNVPLGTTWSEDLLFLEVDVAAIDLNVSFVFDVEFGNSNSSSFTYSAPYQLVDDGGFVNLNTNLRPACPPAAQDNLKLSDRAETIAWWTLFSTMQQPIMNLTTNNAADPSKSKVGQTFQATDVYGAPVTSPDILSIDLGGASTILFSGIPGYNSTTNLSYNVSRASNLALRNCTGWQPDEKISISSIPVVGSILLGAPTKLDGSQFDIADEGMTLKRKIYAFAAAAKLSIKTVQFSYNSSAIPLDGLSVLDIAEKQYLDASKLPRWALETPPLANSFIPPLWGLVSKEYENVQNISTIRSPSFYPVTSSFTYSLYSGWQVGSSYVTGSSAISGLLNYITSMKPSIDTSRYSNGKDSFLLLQRWQSLSQNSTSAAQIVKLIFTNMAANYLRGTRGQLSEDIVPPPFRNLTGSKLSVEVPTHVRERVVRYHWPYGIPAFLSFVLLAALVIVASGAIATGSIAKISRCLSFLSAGRLLTDLLSNGSDEAIYQEKYKPWSHKLGRTRFQLFATGWKDRSMWNMELRDTKQIYSKNADSVNSNTIDDGNSQPVYGEARPFLDHQS